MARIETHEVRALVPVEVLDRARKRLRRQGLTVSEAVRRALAELAEVNPDDYPVLVGRPGHTPRRTDPDDGRAA